jgi:hypothetical protein
VHKRKEHDAILKKPVQAHSPRVKPVGDAAPRVQPHQARPDHDEDHRCHGRKAESQGRVQEESRGGLYREEEAGDAAPFEQDRRGWGTGGHLEAYEGEDEGVEEGYR